MKMNEFKKEAIDDRNYWNSYYKKNLAPVEPSNFALYISKYFSKDKKILDLGCGNGRDSLYFLKKHLKVIGIDSSEDVISSLKSSYPFENLVFVCEDFTADSALYQQKCDYCYSRFTLHAISESQQHSLIPSVYRILQEGSDTGFFFIEVRSVNDEIFGKGKNVARNAYIYEGHFRRFIVKKELEQELIENNFEIIESLEERGFAPWGDQDPYIIRIVAKKCF